MTKDSDLEYDTDSDIYDIDDIDNYNRYNLIQQGKKEAINKILELFPELLVEKENIFKKCFDDNLNPADLVIIGKQKVIKKMVKMFPNIECHLDKIIEKCFEPNITGFINPVKDDITQISSFVKGEIVLDEILINNKIYYKDKHNGILDNEANLVGVYKNENGVDIYNFFSQYDNFDV